MANVLMRAPRADPALPVPSVPGVTIRPVADAEIDAVGHAYQQTYRGTPDAMTLDEAIADVRAARAGEYGHWLPEACLGAWRADLLLGAVITVLDPPWDDVPPGPFVTDLFVVPEVRRRGVGRALLAAARRAAVGAGSGAVGLRVDDDAPEARALYASLGFRISTR
jgi:GNAT superfamily N-acetyltransferase